MTTGDAVQVGIAVPLLNWRGMMDTNVDGTPDDWGTVGSGAVTWRGGTRPYGLSSLGGFFVDCGTSDRVYMRSRMYSNPVPGGFAFGPEVTLYATPSGYSLLAFRVDVYLLDEDGGTEASSEVIGTGNWTGASAGVWEAESGNASNFTADTAQIEVRFGGAAAFIDPPVLAWKADGSGAGMRTMDSTPSRSGTSLSADTLAGITRDAHGGGYISDPYAAVPKWNLTLSYDYCSEADFRYWLKCYAVNRGASGYKAADGKRLAPQPVVVRHHFLDPEGTSWGAGMSTVSGRPPFIVGNITSFDLSFREHIGWGYSGSVTIEEA